jgi:HD-GYP domain-containing protein (c-di-GMP phosphodiesterase class II)
VSTDFIQIEPPQPVADFLHVGPLQAALAAIAQLGGTCLVDTPPDCAPSSAVSVEYNGEAFGRVRHSGSGDDPAARAARAAGNLLEHALHREMAVADLAGAMLSNYEELNLLYSSLPTMAAMTHPRQIAQWLVDEAAELLNCRRVSLLMVDESSQYLRVVASRGLPLEAQDVRIPVDGTISGQVLLEEGLMIVNNIAEYPELQQQSVGHYDSGAFAVVRVPLVARGEPLGVLTATERKNASEFTARDHKLLQALSAVSASALMNCRLHASVARQMMSTIRALASAVDAKDEYTHDHSARVAQLCVATARQLNERDETQLHEIELASLLHDVGKIGIPDSILLKRGSLTEDEFAKIKEHAAIGARIVGHVEGMEGIAKAILHHHERYDGLGYPAGLTGQKIPLISRLITVADAFDCLTTDRPYRDGTSPESALAEIEVCRGTHFDPRIADAFARVVDPRTRKPISRTHP